MKTLSKLIALFIALPLVELALLIWLSEYLSLPGTLLLVVVTGTVGAWLARRQGLSVLRRAREETGRGQLPGGALVDGVLILLAGALLITPGVLTDIVGFACLIPGSRSLVKIWLQRRFARMVQSGQVQIRTSLMPGSQPSNTVTTEARVVDDDATMDRPTD